MTNEDHKKAVEAGRAAADIMTLKAQLIEWAPTADAGDLNAQFTVRIIKEGIRRTRNQYSRFSK